MEAAQEKLLVRGLGDFLLVACPAAGKTMTAGGIAGDLLAVGAAQQIVIVVHTTNLRRQWANTLHACGIEVNPSLVNGNAIARSKYVGCVVTFQQVLSGPLFFEQLCAERPTLVIVDEGHHAGEDTAARLKWGPMLKQAFGDAAKRLLLSGTPFRTDNNPLPFVMYDAAGKCIADFTYSYGQALEDGVCRLVQFDTWDGDMEWLSLNGRIAATFRDEIPEEEAGRRLATALDPGLDWIRAVLVRANDALSDVRRDDMADAGGLVRCMNIWHAEAVAELLKNITGEAAVIVHSGIEKPELILEQFERSGARWLVAVNLVTEGVDIPRLAVGVYASNVLTRQAFIQFIGRFVRKRRGSIDWERVVSLIFIPNLEELESWAAEIRDIVNELIKKSIEPQRAGGPVGPGGQRQLPLWTPISAAADAYGFIVNGLHVPARYRIEAEAILRQHGLPLATEPSRAEVDRLAIMFFLRDGATAGTNGAPTVQDRQETEATYRQEERYAGIRKERVRGFSGLLRKAIQFCFDTADLSGDRQRSLFQAIESRLMRETGVSGRKDGHATPDQLSEHIALLEGWNIEIVEANQRRVLYPDSVKNYLEDNWGALLGRLRL